MSLDVYLISDTPFERTPTSGIFLRENGSTREISREEWDRRNPGRELVVFRGEEETTTELYHRNITHNLREMAEAAGIYQELWRPDEIGITHAKQLIEPLTRGLLSLWAEQAKFEGYDPENGWGNYEGLVAFVIDYLRACVRFPDAKVEVSR